ncbi:MAG: alpha/beta family hydrolase [Bacteroidia bacterium]
MITETKFEATPEKGEVSAVLLRPQNANRLLVLGHGAGAGMYHHHMESIATHLAEIGIATFRYQFPFRERGGGRDSLKVSLATVRSAILAAHQMAPDLSMLAGGHSFGGRMTYLAAAEDPESNPLPYIKGLVFFSFPLHAPGKPGVERAATLHQVPVPMLFLSGERDVFAKHELIEPLLQDIPQATLCWLETGDHGYKILKRTRQNPQSIYEEAMGYLQEWLLSET